MKIAYVISTLESQGGTERVITEKANYLADIIGYDVTIICYNQRINTPNYFCLSKNIKQINLNIQYYSQYQYRYPKRLFSKIQIEHRLKKEISKTVRETNPDILVGITHFRADIVCDLACRAIKVIESHIPRSYMNSNIGKKSILSKLFSVFYNMKNLHTIEKKADVVITLSEEEKKQWRKVKRVEVIPNYSSMQISQLCDYKAKNVISVGRISKEKGFNRLISIWEIVVEKHPDWWLNIYGDGDL